MSPLRSMLDSKESDLQAALQQLEGERMKERALQSQLEEERLQHMQREGQSAKTLEVTGVRPWGSGWGCEGNPCGHRHVRPPPPPHSCFCKASAASKPCGCPTCVPKRRCQRPMAAMWQCVGVSPRPGRAEHHVGSRAAGLSRRQIGWWPCARKSISSRVTRWVVTACAPSPKGECQKLWL